MESSLEKDDLYHSKTWFIIEPNFSKTEVEKELIKRYLLITA